MVPKKKASPAAGRLKSKAKHDCSLESPAACHENNTDHYLLVSKWLDVINGDPLLAHKAEEPLSVSEGAHLPPFNATDFKQAMKNGTVYTCSGCFAWQNSLKSPSPGVSINTKKIQRDIKESFPGGQPPSRIQQTIVIQVCGDGYDPMQHKGDLRRLSPCEFVHLVLGGAASAVENGVSDAWKRDWNKVLRTVTYRFQQLSEDEMKSGVAIAAFSHRESLVLS